MPPLPSERAINIFFFEIGTIIKRGREERMMPANSGPQSMLSASPIIASPTCTVLISSLLVTIMGHRYELNDVTNDCNESANITDEEMGMRILDRHCQSPAPSILALSLSSFGSEEKNCFTISVCIAGRIDVETMPRYVSSSLSFLIRRKLSTRSKSEGMKSVNAMNKRKKPFPWNSMKENAYAVAIASDILRTTVIVAVTKEFSKNLGKYLYEMIFP